MTGGPAANDSGVEDLQVEAFTDWDGPGGPKELLGMGGKPGESSAAH